MSKQISLGLDLGTSALKAVLLDERGGLVGHTESRLTIERPQEGWSQQEPSHWWAAACTAVDALRARFPDAWSQIVAIGLSGQMHGAVTLDRLNRPVRPAILHNDGRSVLEYQMISRTVPSVADVAGSQASAGMTAPKLLWMSRHEPANFAMVDCVLSPKDYLRLRLTGERATDYSDAAGTLWLDARQRRWSEQLANASGISLKQLPPLLEAGQIAGTLLPEVATQLQLRPSVVVATGAADTPASGLGIGCVGFGEAFVNLSTSASIVVAVDRPVLDDAKSIHALCHAVPGRWYQMGAMLSGASCLRWITRTTRVPDEATMLQLVENNIGQGIGGWRNAVAAPIFLPYLSGERTPHNNVDATGVFFGLGHATDTAALGYAVMEGVCFGLRDVLNAIESTGTRVGVLSAVGGGARSGYWMDLLASVLRKPVRRVEGGDLGAAIGAARLGWMALGGDMKEVFTAARTVSYHVPNEQRAAQLDARYLQYRALYQALDPVFRVRAQNLQSLTGSAVHASEVEQI